MSSYNAFHKVIQARVDVEDKLHGGDPLLQWELMIEQFSADLLVSISFIQNEISDVELYWLSEVFDTLLLKTKSLELLECLKSRIELVQDEKMKKEVTLDLNEAVGVAGLF